jgi:hypothetical protein
MYRVNKYSFVCIFSNHNYCTLCLYYCTRANGCPWSAFSCICTIEVSHLDVLEWAVVNAPSGQMRSGQFLSLVLLCCFTYINFYGYEIEKDCWSSYPIEKHICSWGIKNGHSASVKRVLRSDEPM